MKICTGLAVGRDEIKWGHAETHIYNTSCFFIFAHSVAKKWEIVVGGIARPEDAPAI